MLHNPRIIWTDINLQLQGHLSRNLTLWWELSVLSMISAIAVEDRRTDKKIYWFIFCREKYPLNLPEGGLERPALNWPSRTVELLSTDRLWWLLPRRHPGMQNKSVLLSRPASYLPPNVETLGALWNCALAIHSANAVNVRSFELGQEHRTSVALICIGVCLKTRTNVSLKLELLMIVILPVQFYTNSTWRHL